ncbi:hypothetical protein Bbelb_067910 [Branchiostoma belcheri]|nr:hypothetical protein Bbelb_067910 [Branchiostoma belcheri]
MCTNTNTTSPQTLETTPFISMKKDTKVRTDVPRGSYMSTVSMPTIHAPAAGASAHCPVLSYAGFQSAAAQFGQLIPVHVGPVHAPVCAVGPVSYPVFLSTFLEVWEADTVYLTMWDLTMLLCVLWDLSAILCTCMTSPYSRRTCIPVHIPGGSACVSRSEGPVISYETREHRT